MATIDWILFPQGKACSHPVAFTYMYIKYISVLKKPKLNYKRLCLVSTFPSPKMASSFLYFLFLSIALHLVILASSAKATFELDAFTLPVKKDNATLQYTTTVKIGANASSINVAIDIGDQLLWFDCNLGYNSSTFHYIQCGTAECDAEGAVVYCKICFTLPNLPPCPSATCGIDHYNPFITGIGSITGTGSSGDLAKDTLTINSIDVKGIRKGVKVPINVPLFSFSCVPQRT